MAVVAGSAADGRLPGKKLFVEIGHHLHHLASGLLGLLVVARVIPHDVAVIALHAERCGDVLHDQLPLILGNVLQNLHIAQLKPSSPTGTTLGRLSALGWRSALRRLSPLRRRRLLSRQA